MNPTPLMALLDWIRNEAVVIACVGIADAPKDVPKVIVAALAGAAANHMRIKTPLTTHPPRRILFTAPVMPRRVR